MRALAADALDRKILNGPQQLGLRRQRQIGHFVEEQRAAVGRLELPAPAAHAGRRALLDAEQLRFEQRLDERGAVDRDERTVAPPAQLVNLPRDQLLAHAALAQKRRIVEVPNIGVFVWTCRRISSGRAGGSGPSRWHSDRDERARWRFWFLLESGVVVSGTASGDKHGLVRPLESRQCWIVFAAKPYCLESCPEPDLVSYGPVTLSRIGPSSCLIDLHISAVISGLTLKKIRCVVLASHGTPRERHPI